MWSALDTLDGIQWKLPTCALTDVRGDAHRTSLWKSPQKEDTPSVVTLAGIFGCGSQFCLSCFMSLDMLPERGLALKLDESS